MEALCRLCLNKDAPLKELTNAELQEIYENLTLLPFKSEKRPLSTCYICLALLGQAYKLKMRCLQAELYLRTMVTMDTDTEFSDSLAGTVTCPLLLAYSIIEPIKININPKGIVDIKMEIPKGPKSFGTENNEDIKAEFISEMGILQAPNEMQDAKGLEVTINHETKNISIMESNSITLFHKGSKIKIEDPQYGNADIVAAKTVHIVNQDTEECLKESNALIRINGNRNNTLLNTVNTKVEIDELDYDRHDMCNADLSENNPINTLDTIVKIDESGYERPPDRCTANNLLNEQLAKGISHPSTNQNHLKPYYDCDKCHESFADIKNLKGHTCSQPLVKPFKCNICQKSFSVNSNLKKHALIHLPEKPFKCDTCQKSFSDSSNFKKHTSKHSPDSPFKCGTCQMSFSDHSTLKTHALSHIPENPFKCDTCQKSFRYQYTLKKHVSVHTDEKPFKCDTCQKRFRYQHTLKQHTFVHTGEKPFKCDTCQKSFRYQYVLKQHSIVHTGGKRFKCGICPKSFRYRYTLKKHTFEHTGEKPHKLL